MVNQDFTIKDIQKVLNINGKITNINITRLTAAGENYLSLVFKVDFDVAIENGLSTRISTVAKRLPKQANLDGLRIASLAMKNEIRWYLEMVPLFKQIADECGILCEYFPLCMGSRFTLDSRKTCADEEAVLLLENLIIKGYKNEDRYVGFDLPSSKAFLKTIASFHAITLVAKFKKPQIFRKIKNFMDSIPNPEPPLQNGFNPERLVMDLMLQLPACQPYRGKIEALRETAVGRPVYREVKEPWNTVIHGDFWLNNVMVKMREQGEPLTKLLDFQFLGYSSYAIDVVFFMLTSVKSEVQISHFDELLRYYYDQLTSIFTKLNIPELSSLTYQDYLEEVKRMARKSECRHAFFFTTVVYGPKGTGPDPLLGEVDMFENLENMINNMGEMQKEKLGVIVELAAARGWI